MSTASPTKPKVYKKHGAPLSEAAQYHAKLKSGVYSNPGRASLGVDSKESGAAAALLAAKSDLTVHPYQREPSSDAAKAALAAKSDSIASWSPKVSNYSTSAATSAQDTSLNSNQRSYSIASSTSSLSTSAAKSLLSNNTVNRAPTKSNSISSNINYERLNAKASQTASVLISSRIEPAKDSRHGLIGKTGSRTSTIDYSRLNEKALRNASALLANAEKPDKEFRHGIASKTPSYDASHAASGALAAENVKQPEYVSSESKYSKIDKNVLAQARANAAKSLDNIDKSNAGLLFTNKDFNEAAIKIAQKRREERDSNSRTGQYNLGGGLFMPVEEVEAIARKNIDPVLADIEVKAAEQRKLDEEYEAEQARLRQEKLEHEAELRAQRLEERKENKEIKQGFKQELRSEKESYAQKKKELEDLKSQEVVKQKEILAELEKKHALTVEQLSKEKELENDKLYKELTEFRMTKESELKKLHSEHEANLKPIIDKLDREQRIYNDLKQEEESLEAISKLDKEKLETAEKLLAKSQKQLEKSGQDLKLAETNLEKAQNDEEKIVAQAEVDRLKAEVEVKITEEKENQAAQKQAVYESQRSHQEVLKNKKEIELKDAALKALQEEKKLAQIHPGVNDHKIKALEEEIKQLQVKEEEFVKKEERKQFEAQIAKQEEAIKQLEVQKQALIDKENVLIAELKQSDEQWKEFHDKFNDLNMKDDAEYNVESEVDVESEHPLTNQKTPSKQSHVTKEPIKSTAVDESESPKKSDNFLNKVVTNLTKVPKQTKEEQAIANSPNSSPSKRKRGFSFGNLLKKDNSNVSSKDNAYASPKQFVKESGSKSTDTDADNNATNSHSKEDPKNNELKHSFTNFTQGSEIDEAEEMDELFGRPADGKEKAVFTEDV